uniref:Uncharacterized protein n=1 Tax=Oryzias melastigma TaxID=30732 RepID=A0A3B3B7B2_ORYME
FGLFAALVTVQPVAEGADAGGDRRKTEVVVIPLAKQRDHVGKLIVIDHACISHAQDVVGHLSYLKEQNRNSSVSKPKEMWISEKQVYFRFNSFGFGNCLFQAGLLNRFSIFEQYSSGIYGSINTVRVIYLIYFLS